MNQETRIQCDECCLGDRDFWVEPYDKEESVVDWWRQHYYPLLLGDTDRAVEYYSRALDNREPQALMWALSRAGDHLMFPEFYNHPIVVPFSNIEATIREWEG